MAQGWIALNRSILDNWVYDDGAPFSTGLAWIDLLLLANHDDHKVIDRGQVVEAKRGEVNRSLKWLADRWHWSQWKVRHFLGLLEADGMVVVKANKHHTTVTIENYDKYQIQPRADREQTVNRPRADREQTVTYNNVTMNNNVTMDNKERGVKRPRFSPPSVEEVRAYCEEHDYAVDPERFVDFYQSKGWLVGKSKMKDWKAAVRSWASRHEKEDRHTAQNDDWSFMDL